MRIILKLNLLSVLTFVSIVASSQQVETVYRRSSLYPLMINEPSRQYADIILQTFVNSPIPDKFNDHVLNERKVDNGIPSWVVKREEKIKAQEENITNYLNNNDVAKAIVAKWFNRDTKGVFNMDLVADRGSYDATELDVKIAKSSKRGLALLADAGEELINNTFVIINDFDYVNKEEVANKAKAGLSLIKDLASEVNENFNTEKIDRTLTFVGKGYVVRTTSYLYKLDWNDSVAAVFYEEYWMDKNSFDPTKKEAFDNSNIFKLKLIGWEVAWADLQSTSETKKSEEELVTVATKRAIDAVIAKLQRKYEVFRTKTPLYSTDPIAAKIGLKEGLEKGDKFEVLEQVMDSEGRTRYKRRGILKVDKNHIWDNRFMAGEESNGSNPASSFEYTTFIGSGKFYSGMLIRQIN